MRKMIFLFISGALLFSSCAPRDWFLVNSSGIATYNRATGSFEILWEAAVSKPVVIHDTVFVDSCKVDGSSD